MRVCPQVHACHHTCTVFNVAGHMQTVVLCLFLAHTRRDQISHLLQKRFKPRVPQPQRPSPLLSPPPHNPLSLNRLQAPQVSSLLSVPEPFLNQAVTLQVLDQVADEKSLIVAVGYMLRSSPAVVAAKRLMEEVGCTCTTTLRLMLTYWLVAADQYLRPCMAGMII